MTNLAGSIMSAIWAAFIKLLNNPMAFVLLIIALLALIVLWSIQAKRDNFDLRALITDPRTHQPSVHKMGELVALIVSTWLIVYLALNGKIDENYFGLYMAVWAGAQVANNWVSNKYNPAASTTVTSSTVSTVVPSGATVVSTDDSQTTTPDQQSQ
jgi:hypothetical protein